VHAERAQAAAGQRERLLQAATAGAPAGSEDPVGGLPPGGGVASGPQRLEPIRRWVYTEI